MNNRFVPAFGEIVHVIHAFELFAGYSVRVVGTPGVEAKQKLTAGFDVALQPMTIMANLFPIFMTSLGVQILVFDVIRVLYEFIFPLGILLMILPPTRNFGKELIAITFSFALFMPFFFIIIHVAVEDIGKKTGLTDIHTGLVTGLIDSISKGLGTIVLSYFSLIPLLVNGLLVVVNMFAYASFVSILVPTFVLISTITLTSTIAKALSEIS